MLDPILTKSMNIRELSSALENQMREFGYAESSLTTYRGICNKMVCYFEERGVDQFNVELGRKFIVEYGGDRLGTDGALKNYFRAVHMLADLQQFGMVFKYGQMTKVGFSSGFESLFEAFLKHIRKRGIAEGSVCRVRSVLRRFENYLLNRGVTKFNELKLQHINTYIETLAGFSRNTISFTFSYLKKLMDYAYEKGYHDQSFALVLPHIKYSQSSHLPAVFTPEEVERILKNIDTDSPIGKRNYAIILLLARLGIRISDILNLQFRSIDWERKRIIVRQQKTCVPTELPLLEDVGWAIIDYLQNARPKTTCQNIFICHRPPYDRIHSWMAKEITRAVQKAGIRVPPGKTIGAHTFRHSLATNLLNRGASIEEIAQMLGHASIESSEAYFSMSIPMLKLCAREVNI